MQHSFQSKQTGDKSLLAF